jgi:hypothetical protein
VDFSGFPTPGGVEAMGPEGGPLLAVWNPHRLQSLPQDTLSTRKLIAERARRIWRGPGANLKNRDFPAPIEGLICSWCVSYRRGGVY